MKKRFQAGLLLVTLVIAALLLQYLPHNNKAFAAVGTISGVVYLENDYDGYFDSGDSYLQGIEVDLYRDVNDNNYYDPGDTLIASETTDANGEYTFSNVWISENESQTAYVLRIDRDKPSNNAILGVNPSSVFVGSGREANPPVVNSPSKGARSHMVILTEDAPTYSQGFFSFTNEASTFYERTDVSGKVYYDQNNNQAFDGSDVALPGVLVKLYGRVAFTTYEPVVYYEYTDENGDYRFDDFLNGSVSNYTIVVTATEDYEPSVPVVGNPGIFMDDGNPNPRHYTTISPSGSEGLITGFDFTMTERAELSNTSCSAVRGVDVYFAVDTSDSMNDIYDEGTTKMQAALDAIDQIGTAVVNMGYNSRVGAVNAYIGGGFGYQNLMYSNVGLSNDMSYINTHMATNFFAAGDTSLIHPLIFATQELAYHTDGINKPIVIYISDGVPTTTYKPNHSGMPNSLGEGLTFSSGLNWEYIETVPLKDGANFLPFADIINYGGINYDVEVDGVPYRLGELFTDVLGRVQNVDTDLPNRLAELEIHTVGFASTSGYDQNLPELMEYMAYLGNGTFNTPSDIAGLIAALENAVEEAVCAPDTPAGQIGDTVFVDENENAIQDVEEGGIEGVTVSLFKDQNNNQTLETEVDVLVENVLTNNNGEYSFDDTNVINRDGDGNRYFAAVLPDAGDNPTLLDNMDNIVYVGPEDDPANYSRDISGFEINMDEVQSINENADFGFVLGAQTDGGGSTTGGDDGGDADGGDTSGDPDPNDNQDGAADNNQSGNNNQDGNNLSQTGSNLLWGIGIAVVILTGLVSYKPVKKLIDAKRAAKNSAQPAI